MPHFWFVVTWIHTAALALQAGEGLGHAGDELTSSLARLNAALGLSALESVRVVHCAHAFAVVLVSEAGWKLVYSGDTRPCDQMVEAARDATILIHEVGPADGFTLHHCIHTL